MRTLGQVMMETLLLPFVSASSVDRKMVVASKSILSCVVVISADGIIASRVVCNPVSMNYIFEQYYGYPLFFNCCLKHDMFSMNSHVNGFFW